MSMFSFLVGWFPTSLNTTRELWVTEFSQEDAGDCVSLCTLHATLKYQTVREAPTHRVLV